jgi:hypothetical protein
MKISKRSLSRVVIALLTLYMAVLSVMAVVGTIMAVVAKVQGDPFEVVNIGGVTINPPYSELAVALLTVVSISIACAGYYVFRKLGMKKDEVPNKAIEGTS